MLSPLFFLFFFFFSRFVTRFFPPALTLQVFFYPFPPVYSGFLQFCLERQEGINVVNYHGSVFFVVGPFYRGFLSPKFCKQARFCVRLISHSPPPRCFHSTCPERAKRNIHFQVWVGCETIGKNINRDNVTSC